MTHHATPSDFARWHAAASAAHRVDCELRAIMREADAARVGSNGTGGGVARSTDLVPEQNCDANPECSQSEAQP